ncbi:MAG: trypsin-like peptidase domain-containing protein [Polyangiaceae bacterium]|nr:trypsin-like peptidase domain-containing protein [Polyangiaceae bacterium]
MRTKGNPEGPYPMELIVKYIYDHLIDATAEVCATGQSVWIKITEVEAFATALYEASERQKGARPPLAPTAEPSTTFRPPEVFAAGGHSPRPPAVMRVETPATPVVSPTPSAPQRLAGGTRGVKRRRAFAIVGALATILLVVAGSWAIMRPSRTTRDARVRQALVHVVAGDSGGAGFFVAGPDANAYVVTAYHVIESGDPVRIERMVEVSDKKSYVEAYPSTEVVAVDPDADLAIVRLKEVQADRFSTLPLAKGPVKDEKITAHGFPRSNLGKLESSVSQEGKISATTKFRVLDRVTRREVRANAIEGIIISAQLEPGYSGGPTVNENDEVAGVNVLKDKEHTQQNGAVSVEVLAKLLATLKPAEAPPPPNVEEVKALLTKIQTEYLKRPTADRMEIRESEFVASEDLPMVRKMASEIAELSHDMSPDENKITGPARLGFVFAGLPGKGLATYRSSEVTKELAPCPKQALALFGLGRDSSGKSAKAPIIDCENYASRALAWDLTASVLQWEDAEQELTVSSVEKANDDSRAYKATVSTKGSATSFSVWVSTEQGRLRLKLFDDSGKPYWIERHGSADAAAFNGTWYVRGTRQRVVLSDDVTIDAKITERLDISVDAEGNAQVKHHFLREWYTDPGKLWTCNQSNSMEVGMEQNFRGVLKEGAIRMFPTVQNRDGSPKTERVGVDGRRCTLPVHYTADKLFVLRIVQNKLVLHRTDGSTYPERIDFAR